MPYALIENGEVVTYPLQLHIWRQEHPNISMPLNPTTEQLNEWGIYEVVIDNMPIVDITQKFVPETPVLEDNVCKQKWKVVDATPEEIAGKRNDISNQNKEQAMKLLAETDWVELPSVSDPSRAIHLLNYEDFMSYRIALRRIAVIAPSEYVTWPQKPKEQWS